MISPALFRQSFKLAAVLSGLILSLTYVVNAQTVQPPVILFTDLVSGPATGNSDSSQPGQLEGQDGVIVTVWGKYLGTAPGTITVGGIPARIYSWGNATGPADLYTRHKMQMVVFQIPHGVSAGATTIQASVGGVTSNTLPFTVRSGGIYFVATTGNDSTGTGSWSAPWLKISNSALKLNPGDTLYVRNGVQQITNDAGGGCSAPGCAMALEYGEDSSQFATAAMPKAMIAYPGATAQIGTASLDAWGTYNGGSSPDASYWTISKMTLLGAATAAGYGPGFRLIGNHISTPNGDGQTGAIGGGDSTNLFILGNELTNCGYAGTSKLYHPLYVQSLESGSAPRLPDENNREIGWNYLHDNYAYDGINLYRENSYSAFMLHTLVHDNWVVNQTGRGMLIGTYVVGPDNYFYNNVIINAGQGPDSNYTSDPAFNYQCVYFSAGWSAYPGTTTIHFYNNTLYNCGFNDTGNPSSSSAMISYDNGQPFTLDFRNNIIQATSWPYTDSTFPAGSGTKNIWYGQGTAPSWDNSPISQNPLLVSPATGDAHLQAGSPAIGAGSTAAPSVAIDFDNLLRPSPPSIGAFEFSGASAPPADTTAPSVPTGLSAAAISSSQVNLSWTAASDPDNSASQIAYTVYRNGTQIAKVAAGSTSYSDTGLAAATSYAYTVAAFDPAGNTSAQSSPVSVTTPAAPVPVISSFTASPSTITAGGSSILSWSVSSATSVSISGIGTVTGTSVSVAPVQTTTYTLTATNSVGSVTAQTTVTVTPAVSIGISPTTITLGQGQQQPFTATVTGASNTAVTWSFSPAVGTLSSSGLYTAPATVSSQQTVTVTATSVADSTKSASAKVTLQPPAPAVSITLTPASTTLGQGQPQQFTATVTGASNTAVTWSFTPATGTLSSSGLYTAPATISSQQTVTVTATSVADSTKSASAQVTLQPPAPVGSIAVNPASATLGQGQLLQFTATVTGAGNAPISPANTAVTWSFTPAVGTLSSSGLYTAPATISSQQTVTVTATSVADSTKSASAKVTLQPPAPAVSITLTPASATLGQGQPLQFTATVTGAGNTSSSASNTAVTWSFTPAVGSLSNAGLYTAPATISSQQTVTVTATSVADSTKSASAKVTLQPPAQGVSIAVFPTFVILRQGQRQQFRAIVTGTKNTAVIWSFTPAVGRLSANGVYTAPATITTRQTVTITATSAASPAKSAHATVTLVPRGGVQISDFGAFQITATSATVTWDTNVATLGQVQYGTTAAYGQSAPFTILQWSHTVTLTGLTPGTLYHYQVQAWTDPTSGVTSTADLTFTTPAQ